MQYEVEHVSLGSRVSEAVLGFHGVLPSLVIGYRLCGCPWGSFPQTVGELAPACLAHAIFLEPFPDTILDLAAPITALSSTVSSVVRSACWPSPP